MKDTKAACGSILPVPSHRLREATGKMNCHPFSITWERKQRLGKSLGLSELTKVIPVLCPHCRASRCGWQDCLRWDKSSDVSLSLNPLTRCVTLLPAHIILPLGLQLEEMWDGGKLLRPEHQLLL